MARVHRLVTVSTLALTHLAVACGLGLEASLEPGADVGVPDAADAPQLDASDAPREDAAPRPDGGDASDADADTDAVPADACVPEPERCDGIDNDCDDQIDEGCECVPNSTSSCYSGPAGTVEVGRCVGGTRTCSAEGTFGECVGERLPLAEICNGDDDDCDGQTDEGNPGGGGDCNTGQSGVCADGTLRCASGALGCVRNTGPSAEICDGKDNDCDGQIDEGNPGGGIECDTGAEGECAAGSTRCTGGQIRCESLEQPALELCDGKDNDCDGQIDEGNPEGGGDCDTGLAAGCAQGTFTCLNGDVRCVPNDAACP